MIAAVFTTPGGPEQIELIEVDVPVPGAGEVLIQVAAAAVNPVDLQTRGGIYHDFGWVHQPEHTGLGWDVAGIVTAVGADVDPAWVGRRVAALAAGVDRALGAYAESVVVPVTAVAGVPETLELVAAATVPLNALTADQAVESLGEAGGTLEVTGAAGGVGGYALSSAADRGWSVIGLARESDSAFVEGAGARLVTDLSALSEQVAAVVDAAGLREAALAVVADRGRYVGLSPAAPVEAVRGITSSDVFVTADADGLAAALRRTADGVLPARIAREFPLRDAADAHRLLEQGAVRGRIVLRP